MKTCPCCGNHYDKTFDVIFNGKKHTFDFFECAIHRLAPRCTYCKCVIIGHGVEKDNQIFCCAHCAHQMGISELKDRAD